MNKVKNKIALISGGGSGLGKSIAKIFLKKNIKVIIIGRRKSVLKKTQKELKQYGKIYIYKCDISKIKQVEKLSSHVKKNFSKLNILINNAGILGEIKEIKDYNSKIWEKVININLNGNFYLTKSCINLLKNQENSIIINVSSSVADNTRSLWGAYCVSKFAVKALSEIISKELKNKIKVYLVNPGAMKTNMRKEAYPNENPNRLENPDKVAKLFLDVILKAEYKENNISIKYEKDKEKNEL